MAAHHLHLKGTSPLFLIAGLMGSVSLQPACFSVGVQQGGQEGSQGAALLAIDRGETHGAQFPFLRSRCMWGQAGRK